MHGNVSKSFGRMLIATALITAACSGEPAEQETEATPSAAEAAPGSDAGGAAAMGQAPHGRVSMVAYECAEGGTFTLTVAPGVSKAALGLADGQVHQLDQVEVASGMEFSDGTYTFRGVGPEASVDKDGEPLLVECVASGHPQ